MLSGLVIGAIAAMSVTGSVQDTQPRVRTCGIEGFTQNPIEHIINDIGPFTVKRLRGVIRDSSGNGVDFGGQAILEIMGPQPSQRVRKAVIASDGRFSFRDLPAGSYCLRAMAIGFQSVIGQVVVAPSGRVDAPIEITLRIGV